MKLIVELQSAAPEAAGRDFPFSSLFSQLPGLSFGFGPASACRSPESICSPPRQNEFKGAAASGALAHSGGGREQYGGGGASLRRQRRHDVAAARGASCVLPGKLSPDHGTLAVGGLHRLPGGAVWRVTCARTQASWWWQQRP